jgi:putative membrane protein
MGCATGLLAQGTSTGELRGQLSERDYRFAAEAARGGMAEVQMGQLAIQKGANPTVRSFGQRMVTDHSQADHQLTQVLAQKGASPPANLSTGDRLTLGRLENLSGANFDKAYAEDMVKDHEKDVKDFEKNIPQVADPELKAWAEKTLPILQQHLSLARQMQNAASN